MKDFVDKKLEIFSLRHFLCSLSLLYIDLRIPVVIHGFFSSYRNAFLTVLYTEQIENSVSPEFYEVKH